MEVVPYHPLVTVTQEDMKKVRQSCDVDDVQRIRDSLDTIDEWLKKQPHLAEAGTYISRSILERVFILAKGSVEGTKSRLEKMLTSRGMMPELCLRRSIEEFHNQWDAVHYVPLPKLHPVDQSRVMVTQFLTGKLESFSLMSYFRYCFM
ncbi:putative CRAL/TRIO domain-containing protein, partial [Operophtera brumata]